MQPRIHLTDPEFRYPESHNPYWAKLREQGSPVAGRVYCDNDTELHRGTWRERLPDAARFAAAAPADGSRRELHVEVGCNGGHVALEWAARDPKGAYLGIDWKFKQIHRGAEKAAKRGIGNLAFLRANSERLRYMFGPGEIDRLYLYFPDPWEKPSERKNRWFTADRLRQVAPAVRTGGIFHVKTDHAGYFEWMTREVGKAADLWRVVERTEDLHGGNPLAKKLGIPDVTLFEKIFVAEGRAIKSMRLERLA
jgi:tRNA (guanine-N7-)-methyltransferase